MNVPPSFDLIDDVDLSGLKVAVVRAALELDVFGLVEAGVTDDAGLAAALGASGRGVTVLVRALCSLGLLERVEGRLQCSDTAAAYLVPESPTSAVAIYLGWLRRRDRLVDAISDGCPPTDHAAGEGAREWRAYAAPDLLRWPTRVPDLTARLTERGLMPAPGEHLLDLGCGSGIVGFTMAAAVEGVRVTSVDRPAVLDVTGHLATAMGLADRVTLEVGDVLSWTIPPNRYDQVLVVNIAQYIHDEPLVDLLARARAAIRPGGRLYLATPVIDDGTPGNDTNWASAIEMYLNSNVDQRNEAAVYELFSRGGWSDVQRLGPNGFLAHS